MHQRRTWANRNIDVAQAFERGWAYLADGSHDFGLTTIYVTRGFQIRQLREHGLAVEATFGVDGRELREEENPRDMMIHYLCRHA